MMLKIVVSSGKGGTGKTFISTNLAVVLADSKTQIHYLDCDVEEPNGHLFLKPDIRREETVTLMSPAEVDAERCTACGQCVDACHYNALAMVHEKVLFFQNMCHVCGACTLVCPARAIVEKERVIGKIRHGQSGSISTHDGLLETAEGGMSPRLIKRVKQAAGEGVNILDSPPGTSCPVVETVKDADLCVLVTDPTPFGIHDLKLAVDMCRKLDREPVVIVNRADYINNDLKLYCEEAGLLILGEIPDDRKIAECYSVGDLVAEKMPEYRLFFQELSEKLIQTAKQPPEVPREHVSSFSAPDLTVPEVSSAQVQGSEGHKRPEVVVLSGKGGTGKTSLAASFCALEKELAIADCDVDAADLHLILKPVIQKRGEFSGGDLAMIDSEQCSACGLCLRYCRFDAVQVSGSEEEPLYTIDELSCEGCGVCALVCPRNAVITQPAVNGEWYMSETRFGPMSHAKLGVAEENSGKLVTLVRKHLHQFDIKQVKPFALTDGSPGTGCPVIASLTGTDYAIVVTEPTVSGLHDLKRLLDVVHFFKIPSGVIVNKADLNTDMAEQIRHHAEETHSDFLGMLPYNRQVTEAQVQGLAVVEYAKDTFSEAIRMIWEQIRRKIYPEPDRGKAE